MAVKVEVNYAKTINVTSDRAAALKYLSDFRGNLQKDFPGVEAFEETSPGVYRWRFEKIAHGGKEIQIKLLTKLAPQGNEIKISSVPDPDASHIEGRWHIEEGKGGGSAVTFEARLSTELPLPFLLKAVVGPLAQKELSKLFDRYLRNVENALSA